MNNEILIYNKRAGYDQPQDVISADEMERTDSVSYQYRFSAQDADSKLH